MREQGNNIFFPQKKLFFFFSLFIWVCMKWSKRERTDLFTNLQNSINKTVFECDSCIYAYTNNF